MHNICQHGQEAVGPQSLQRIPVSGQIKTIFSLVQIRLTLKVDNSFIPVCGCYAEFLGFEEEDWHHKLDYSVGSY